MALFTIRPGTNARFRFRGRNRSPKCLETESPAPLARGDSNRSNGPSHEINLIDAFANQRKPIRRNRSGDARFRGRSSPRAIQRNRPWAGLPTLGDPPFPPSRVFCRLNFGKNQPAPRRLARSGISERAAPNTAAGPRRIHTVFPILPGDYTSQGTHVVGLS